MLDLRRIISYNIMCIFVQGGLFVKDYLNYDPICAFCENASGIYDEDSMICKTKGIVSKLYSCRKFVYDPLKRVPPRTVSAPQLDYIDID